MSEPVPVAEIAWFARLQPEVRAELLARGRLQRRAAGEWLYGEGDEDTGLVAVASGALHLYAQPEASRRPVLFAVLPRGRVMGQSAIFGGGPRLVTAICATDCLLFLLPDRALSQVAAAHPSLWPSLAALTYGQLRGAVQVAAEFVALSARERMIARLLAISADINPAPLSQAALGELVGATRNAVSGWLGELEEAGLLVRQYRRIEVLDRAGLERALRRRAEA